MADLWERRPSRISGCARQEKTGLRRWAYAVGREQWKPLRLGGWWISPRPCGKGVSLTEIPRKLGASPGAGQPWRNYQSRQSRLILVASRRDGGNASIVTWHTAGVNPGSQVSRFQIGEHGGIKLRPPLTLLLARVGRLGGGESP